MKYTVKDNVKFKFGNRLIFNPSFVCRGCKFAESFTGLYENCPVFRLVYTATAREHFISTCNDAWFALPNTQHVVIESHDIFEDWDSFSRFKKIAKGCQHNKGR